MNKVQDLTYRLILDYTNYVKSHREVCGHFQLEQDLGFDNLDRIELLMDLEDYFDILLDEHLCKEWFTIDDIIESVIQVGGR